MKEEFYAPVGSTMRFLILIAVSVLLCNYYYIYFVGFNQGVADVSVFFSLFKLVGVFLVSTIFLRFKMVSIIHMEAIFMMFFLLVSVLIYFSKVFSVGLGDVMFINGVVCLAPFLFFESRPNLGYARVFFESCLFVVVIQVFVDYFIFLNGYSAWDNKAFVGGLGNPSSFGLVCNVLVCYVLFQRKRSIISMLSYSTLVFGIYMTSSMLAIIMLFFITGLWFFGKFSFVKFFLGGAGVFLIFLLGRGLISEHLEYKLNSIATVFARDSVDQSESVSIRLNNNIEYAANFADDPVGGVFYGFLNDNYYKYDSQILTYFSSFGVVVSLLFFFSILCLYFKLRFASSYYFLSVIVLIFCFSFLTNRFMDYYPLPIFLGIVFCLLRESSIQRGYLAVK